MTIIIPLGGIGQRFKNKWLLNLKPKALINIYETYNIILIR